MIKIQLWSNADATQFALRLESDKNGFRASTNPNVEYTKLMDEMYQTDDQQIDWQFMLCRWIVSLREGFRHSSTTYDWSQYDSRRAVGIEVLDSLTVTAMKEERKNSKKQSKSKRRRLLIKCNFCNLTFYYETERTAHEKEWHANKLKEASQSES